MIPVSRMTRGVLREAAEPGRPQPVFRTVPRGLDYLDGYHLSQTVPRGGRPSPRGFNPRAAGPGSRRGLSCRPTGHGPPSSRLPEPVATRVICGSSPTRRARSVLAGRGRCCQRRRAWRSPLAAGDSAPPNLRATSLQEGALPGVLRDRYRRGVGASRFLCPAEAAEEIRSNGVQQVVVAKWQRIDELEARFEAVDLGTGDGAVELDDG